MTDFSSDLFGNDSSVLPHDTNNAGNMRGPDGGFQSFSTPKAGVDAMRHDLLLKVSGNSPAMKSNYGQGYQPTLDNIISTWAPPTENNTNNYVDYVSKKSGIAPDAVLSPGDVDKIIPHMITMEHGANGAKQYADAGNIMTDAKVDSTGRDLSGELFGTEQPGKDMSSDLGLIDALRYQTDPLRTAYQGTMNTVAKPINEVVSSAMGAATSPIGLAAHPIASAIDSTSAGQWVGDKLLGASDMASSAVAPSIANLKDLESYNPDLEHDLSAFGQNAQLAGNLPALKPISELGGLAVGKAGEAISSSGVNQALARKTSFVKDLVSPKTTPSVVADQFGRSTEQGLLRQRVVESTPQEQQVIDTVSQLPVSKNKSLLANYNTIADANAKEASDLISKLKSNDAPVDLGDVQDTISNSVNELRQNPYVTGDGEKAALKVVNVMNKAILDNAAEDGSITASRLLQARKDFDQMIKRQKGGKIFDPNLDSPTSIAIQNMRQSINNLVESKMPDIGYKASLQKQSNLYRAMENLEQKGAYEAPNAIARGVQKVANMVPGKALLTKGAVLAGAGTGAAMAPIATGVGLAGYGGYKAATSPITKKIIGGALQRTGNFVGGYAEGGIVKSREVTLTKKLEVKLGRSPKKREIELATYVGPHGVHRLLNQKDTTLEAHKMFPQTIVKEHRALFFNKKKPYTVEQMKAVLS